MMMPKTDIASPATVAQRHRQRSWILRHGARLLTLVISMAGCLSIGTTPLAAKESKPSKVAALTAGSSLRA